MLEKRVLQNAGVIQGNDTPLRSYTGSVAMEYLWRKETFEGVIHFRRVVQ